MRFDFIRGRVALMWNMADWQWRPSFHCTGCCYFWLEWGPLTIGVTR